MSQETLVLFCNCTHYELIAQSDKQEVLNSIKMASFNVVLIDDLCGLAAKKDPILKDWVSYDRLKIVACYPRAVKWLFERADAPLDMDKTEFFNMRTDASQVIIEKLIGDSDFSGDSAEVGKSRLTTVTSKENSHDSDPWIPWFPVIDYDRCVNCKQCLNFCLFGTFQLDDQGKVRVEKPSHCKTNCPACARVCPQKAIIFPKYGDGPVNGDEVVDTDISSEDIKSLVEGDIHEILRNRSKGKRFSTDRRQRINISGLQNDLDIPADVLKSLSADDMALINKKMRQADGQ